MKAREWIDQGLNKYPNLMDLLEDFPLQDGEMETRDMRTREQREVAGTRAPTPRYCMRNRFSGVLGYKLAFGDWQSCFPFQLRFCFLNYFILKMTHWTLLK